LATYIIHQLVEDPANEGLLLSADWYIMPVMNPDGMATISLIPFSVLKISDWFKKVTSTRMSKIGFGGKVDLRRDRENVEVLILIGTLVSRWAIGNSSYLILILKQINK
jgi:hypothetical protein